MTVSSIQKIAGITFTSLVLISCSGETTRSVEWYVENEDARTKVLDNCIDYAGVMDDTPNCNNALQAQSQSSSRLRTIENW